MKKIFILTLIISILLMCVGFSVCAEEVTSDIVTTEAPASSVPFEEAFTEEELLISESVKAFVNEHLSEIISFAGTILTAILIFLHKKGLLPIISKGFGALVEMLNTFKKNVEDNVTTLGDEVKPVIEKMNAAVEECAKMKKNFDKLQELFELKKEEKQILLEKIKESNERDMLTCEMLYQLLMCTNVPQYMKDKICAYYESVKATIAKSTTESKAVSDNEDKL